MPARFTIKQQMFTVLFQRLCGGNVISCGDADGNDEWFFTERCQCMEPLGFGYAVNLQMGNGWHGCDMLGKCIIGRYGNQYAAGGLSSVVGKRCGDIQRHMAR